MTILEKHQGAMAHAAGRTPQIRLWLRLLSVTMVVDKKLRALLAQRFATTLPRFDILAALDRAEAEGGDGLTMGQLSKALLVSNGNVTALVQALVRDGLAETVASPRDRRASIVRLTPAGAAAFREQAEAHHAMIADLFEGLDPADADALYGLLGRLKSSIAAGEAE